MADFQKTGKYINYHNKIKIKESTTRFVGVIVVFIVVFIIFVHFKVFTNVTSKNLSKSNASSTKIESKSKKTTNKNDSYILKDSDKYKLTDEQLENLTGRELMLARNEIFARHGYVFKTEPFKSYFKEKSWYVPDSSFKGDDSELSSIEKYNIKKILKYEDEKNND